jgi:hypothetical protein
MSPSAFVRRNAHSVGVEKPKKILRSSKVASPVTFGRLECGNPAMSLSGVDAVIV